MMEWHVTDAQSLAIIDREIGDHIFTAAEYEIVRRVIYATADFEYLSLIRFSERALQAGSRCLGGSDYDSGRCANGAGGDYPSHSNTFANPVYCSMEALTRPQKEKTQAAWGIQTLARRYPEGIFVVGQAQTALTALIELIEGEEIKPCVSDWDTFGVC
jgi:precorrin-8X/cobalt-precorrin-8 methylmutase